MPLKDSHPTLSAKQNYLDLDFRHLFESSPNAYLIVRANPPLFTIVAATDSYLLLSQTSRAMLLEKPLFEIFPDNPNDPSASGVSDLRISLERVCQNGVPDSVGVQRYDIPNRCDDGFTIKYWTPIQSPIFNQKGKVIFIINQVQDVTDYILLQEKIFAAQQYAEFKFEIEKF